MSYISPTIVLISIGYLCIFSKIKLTNPMKKIVKFFSGTTFSIYLLNSNRFIGDYLIKDKFIHYCNHKTIVLALKVIVFSLLFSILAMLIDKVRIIIFKKIKIEKLAKNITACIEKIAQKIINLL